MNTVKKFFFAGAAGVCAIIIVMMTAFSAWATPSTTFWAPSTTYLQPYDVLHVTYDTYFWGSAEKGNTTSPIYPVDTGLTMGVLPFNKFQVEVGYDLFLPGNYPFALNAKIGSPEGTLFSGSPGWSLGIFGVGFEHNVTDYNIVHFMVGKTVPVAGTFNVGAYDGTNDTLFVASSGEKNPLGVMVGWNTPDITLNLPWMNKLVIAWDIMTGKNAFGATGGGIYFYFTPAIDILTGPVYFFDPALQPGGVKWIWTVQLDVDMDLKPQKK